MADNQLDPLTLHEITGNYVQLLDHATYGLPRDNAVYMTTQVTNVITGLRNALLAKNNELTEAAETAAAGAATAGEAGAALQIRVERLQTEVDKLNELIHQLESYRYFYAHIISTLRNVYRTENVENNVKQLFQAKLIAKMKMTGGYKKQYGGEVVSTNSVSTNSSVINNEFRVILNGLNSETTVTENKIKTLFNSAYKISQKSNNQLKTFIRFSGNIGTKLRTNTIKNKLSEQTRDTDYYSKIIINVMKKNNVNQSGNQSGNQLGNQPGNQSGNQSGNKSINQLVVNNVVKTDIVLINNANQLISNLKKNINLVLKITNNASLNNKFNKINKSISKIPNNKYNKNLTNKIQSYVTFKGEKLEKIASKLSGGKKKKRVIYKKKGIISKKNKVSKKVSKK